MAQSKRPRAQRRRLERELTKLADAKQRLAELSPGGNPERPIDVDSASVVALRAAALGCARCEGDLRVEREEAVQGLRRVAASCKACRAERVIWLRLASRLLS